ncbi:MAG: DNA mismatch repair endonuclease MutL [Clostridiales bacterium]|nr:DNA mismatch repair endonuclease MutL [Clostridiales bacterium]
MPKINILDKHTAELIAAGEVVERPSSAIKELCENAIDAGATKITVEIQHGGITYMRVTDNGCGIEREDVRKAFLRHATSKVKTADDLNAIGTLGFRGEALASVCAVAKVELITKSENEDSGTSYIIEGGEEISFEDTGCPNGTTIIVRDLFYNVPARMKFLKKDVAEGNSVATVMEKIALSHPETAFTFIRDGKRIINTQGDGKLLSAIYSVMGKEFAKELIPLSYSVDNIRAEGYICKPLNAKATRNMQNFFLNGRYIKSRTAAAAIEEAYKGSVMVGKFPACVINIQMDLSTYDVNVHPSKMEVRFVNERPLFDCIYHGVKTALLKGDSAKELFLNSHTNTVNNTFEFIQRTETRSDLPKTDSLPGFDNTESKIEDEPIIFIPKKSELFAPQPTEQKPYVLRDSFKADADEKTAFDNPYHISKGSVEKPLPQDGKKDEPQKEPVISEEPQKDIKSIVSEPGLKIIGEVFDTYIIIQKGDNEIIIVDKHAAHERIIYEKLKKEREAFAQILLEPVIINLSAEQYSAVTDNLELLDKSGYETEDFGNGKVIVRSAPQYLNEDDIQDSIYEIASYLAENKNRTLSERADEILHTTACKAAIKGGNKTTMPEITRLVEMLIANPEIKYCPHGRPITTVIKRRELEKSFGRIQ